jgi:hypothetical protein
VGKVENGVAVLLNSTSHRCIDFPALLLPSHASVGSVIELQVRRNQGEELRRASRFLQLQQAILDEYGTAPPPPRLSLRGYDQDKARALFYWSMDPHDSNPEILRCEVFLDGAERITAKCTFDDITSEFSVQFSGKIAPNEPPHKVELVVKTTLGTLSSNPVWIVTNPIVITFEDESEVRRRFRICTDAHSERCPCGCGRWLG